MKKLPEYVAKLVQVRVGDLGYVKRYCLYRIVCPFCFIKIKEIHSEFHPLTGLTQLRQPAYFVDINNIIETLDNNIGRYKFRGKKYITNKLPVHASFYPNLGREIEDLILRMILFGIILFFCMLPFFPYSS
jgi:hypothetical protein